jgi:hypothetical protein
MTETTKGLLLPCPLCGEADATLSLNLAEPTELHCQECDADFTTADVRNLIARWQPVLAWIDTMPSGE